MKKSLKRGKGVDDLWVDAVEWFHKEVSVTILCPSPTVYCRSFLIDAEFEVAGPCQ